MTSRFDTDHPNIALRVSIFSEPDRRTSTLTFERFPLHVGRSSHNDLVLDHPYVSQHHAAFGLRAGALAVLQLGSSNKVCVSGRNLETDELALLGVTASLQLPPFRIDLRVIGRPSALPADAVDSPLVRRGEGTLSRAPGAPVPAPTHDVATTLRFGEPFAAAATASQPSMARAGEATAAAAANAAAFEALVSHFCTLEKGRHELANRLGIELGVTLPTDPAEMSRALVADGGVASLQRAFVALSRHQLALFEGALAGVRALLEQLSPDAIELEAARENALVGAKTLWRTYQRIHGDLAEEDQHTLETVFGHRFREAYKRHCAAKESA